MCGLKMGFLCARCLNQTIESLGGCNVSLNHRPITSLVGCNSQSAWWGQWAVEHHGRSWLSIPVVWSVWFALENVGAATWKDSIGSLKGGGRLVTCGSTSRPVGETLILLVFWKQVHIIGSTMANRHEFNDVMRLFFAGRLKAILDEMVPPKDDAAAQVRLAEGKQFGKIVLTP